MNKALKRTEYLLYVLSENKTYVRSSDLAKETGVSIRTIKKEIASVNELALSFGAHIESVKSKGYKLVIDDTANFIPKMEQLAAAYRTGTKKIVTKNSDILDICRMILSGHLFSSIDQLADELYLSKNSVWLKLQKLEKLLDKCYLHIDKNNKGYFEITGKEYNIRNFMLFLSEDISIKHVFYIQWFDEGEIAKDLRNILLNILIEKKYHVNDAFTRRLSKYILLANNRAMANCNLQFDGNTKTSLHETKAYLVSMKICLELQKQLNIEFSSEEIEGLALFLLINRDVNRNENLMDDCTFLNDEVLKVMQYLQKENIISEYFKSNDIKVIFYPVLVKNYFGISDANSDANINLQSNASQKIILASPYAIFYSKEITRKLVKKFGYNINEYDIYHVAIEILIYIISLPYAYKRVKVAVCSILGIASANVLSSIIEKRYSELVQIENVELYELRNRKKEDFDVVISDFAGFIYRYDWEHVAVNTIPTKKEMDSIYNSVILNSVDFKSIVEDIAWEKISIYQDFNYHDEDAFAELIAYKLGKDEKCIRLIKENILTSIPYSVQNHTAIFYVNAKYTKENVFEIYHLKNTKKMGDKKVDYIIVMTIHQTLREMRFINDISFTLMNNTEFIKKVMNEKTTNSIIDCAKESLKTLAINMFN